MGAGAAHGVVGGPGGAAPGGMSPVATLDRSSVDVECRCIRSRVVAPLLRPDGSAGSFHGER